MSVDEYVKLMVRRSRLRENELVVECLEKYGLLGVRDLREDQAKEFCKDKGILEDRRCMRI